ncbi:hypothetical protein [Asticcacaulis sp. AC402]|uniref:hypothetical protein n=1 Tax=Asticcacaulis sp. AC402 TaxID=1282361 RepID=UPI0003C3D2F0|nr:hypothetical protein [Asticcacaulis sp. AC402]ESQ75731.1 hypothetical protein ABAC402_07135 [Asticcacaulis sp. AC402]
MLAVTIVSGLFAPAIPPAAAGEPLTAIQAMAIVYAVQSVVVAILAARAEWL